MECALQPTTCLSLSAPLFGEQSNATHSASSPVDRSVRHCYCHRNCLCLPALPASGYPVAVPVIVIVVVVIITVVLVVIFVLALIVMLVFFIIVDVVGYVAISARTDLDSNLSDFFLKSDMDLRLPSPLNPDLS